MTEEVRVKMVAGTLMLELPDSIVSVATTEKGKRLFGGKGVTFYKSGNFVVKIPLETINEIIEELNGI